MPSSKRADRVRIPSVGTYRVEKDGYAFLLDPADVQKLKTLPDFEGGEEPAVAENFLRTRAERWAEALVHAGVPAAQFLVRVDPHQRKTHLVKGSKVAFSADI